MFNSFEHNLLNLCKTYNIKNKSLIIAYSSGSDSTALLLSFIKLQKILKLKLAICHIHHGQGNDKYRNQAWKFAKETSQKYRIDFFSNCQKLPFNKDLKLKNEGELRKYRLAFLQKMLKKHRFDMLVMAHHKNDQLETRLMRLIRGTGSKGLQGINIWNPPILHPFLIFSKNEIIAYLKSYSQLWIEDPSNKNKDNLRNWIRNKCLADLENYQKGGVKRLAISLELLSEDLQNHNINNLQLWQNCLKKKEIIFYKFMILNNHQKKQFISYYLHNILNITSFSCSHVEEIIKQLNNKKNKYIFVMLGYKWHIDAKRIYAIKNQKK